MKSLYFSFILFLLSLTAFAAQNPSQEAFKAYEAKQYDQAALLLQKEVDNYKKEGKVSAALYYNLGNAYFRANELAKAILNYERALNLDPGNRDIRHNIAFANTKVEDIDKIAKTEKIFIQNWFESVERICTSNTWATWAIAFFVLTIVCAFFFSFGREIWIKKVAFYSGITTLVLVILFNLFAHFQKKSVVNQSAAIIMAPSVDLLSAPEEKSNVLIQIHAGLKVRITKTDGDWYEIELDNGNVGWLRSETLEII